MAIAIRIDVAQTLQSSVAINEIAVVWIVEMTKLARPDVYLRWNSSLQGSNKLIIGHLVTFADFAITFTTASANFSSTDIAPTTVIQRLASGIAGVQRVDSNCRNDRSSD
jgi:hypothetical protein